MDIPYFVCLLVEGHLGCFYFMAIMNNANRNICVQVFMGTVFNPMINFKNNTCFSQVSVIFYSEWKKTFLSKNVCEKICG